MRELRSDRPIALVTGASRGIGAATAQLLAANGYGVVINYQRNQAAAKIVQQTIEHAGGISDCVQADIGVASDVERLFDAVDQRGTLAVVVNNAAILRTQQRMENITEERFKAVLQTNVIGLFLCCQQAVRRMSTRLGGGGGAIVNVSSGAAKSGSPHEYVDYAASKGAVDTFTRGLALEVAGEGIRVNGIRPGFIHTEMHADGGEPNRVERIKARIPMQRGGTPQEIAEAILWLASDKSSYVTGSILDIAGGV